MLHNCCENQYFESNKSCKKLVSNVLIFAIILHGANHGTVVLIGKVLHASILCSLVILIILAFSAA